MQLKNKITPKDGKPKGLDFIDGLMARYPQYREELRSERHFFESIHGFPTQKELMCLSHLAECLLSTYERSYSSLDMVQVADDCIRHIWEKRSTFCKGELFYPWFYACVRNYGKKKIEDARYIMSFDSSDLPDETHLNSDNHFGRYKIGINGQRNSITEKSQLELRAYQMDFLSEQEDMEAHSKKNTKKVINTKEYREKVNFDKALKKVLSELRPEARLLYDLYNKEVPFKEIALLVHADTPEAARTRRDGLVKSMKKKMLKYWQAPKEYHYDDPVEPMRKLLMEITFFKGRNNKNGN